MNRPDKIRYLARILNAEKEHQQLNIALTHSSFYVNNQTEKSNSRYVFTGMFAFKGEVASYMSQFVPGNGMQLQHALGNLFRNETLQKLYDRFQLINIIRCGNDFEVEKHIHIFVYGFLGFVYTYSSAEDLGRFISRYIILPNYKIIDFTAKSKDFEAQCNVIAKILFGSKVNLVTTSSGEKQFTSVVSIDEYIISNETAGGYRYSRTKALKKALKILSDDMYFIESQKPDFIFRINKIEQLQEEKIRQQKEEKLRLQAEKEERKRQENAIKKQKRSAEKALRDLERRKAKTEAKQKKESRKGKNTIYREYSAEEIAAMNPAKRRRLEDLGILTKSK